jgi:O-antigen ligase
MIEKEMKPFAHNRIGNIGWYCALLFILAAWVSPSAGTIALLMMTTVVFADTGKAWRILGRDRVFWLLVFFLGYMAWTTLLAIRAQPDSLNGQFNGILRFGQLLLFLPLAYWLKADKKRIRWALILGMASLAVGLMLCPDWSHWMEALQGRRVPIKRWGHLIIGLYAETALLGLLLFGPFFWLHPKRLSNRIRGLCLWMVLVVFFLQFVIISGSRNVWLAVLLVFPPVLFIRYRHLLKSRQFRFPRRWVIIPAALVAVALSVVVTGSYHSVAERLGREHEDFERLVKLETEGYNEYGFGVRVLLNIFGIEKFKERPLFGWGPGTDFKKYGMPHLHNAYLEVLVRFGLAGVVFFALLAFFLFHGLLWAKKKAGMPPDLWLFLLGTFLLTALWCLTDYRLGRADFRFFFIFIAGISYTFYLHKKPSPEISAA